MSRITLVTGGSRSGKSSFAENLLKNTDDVLYIATAIVTDEEMRNRIKKHIDSRNSKWTTYEGFSNLDEAIEQYTMDNIMLDCVTIMTTNLMFQKEIDFDNISMEEVEELLEKFSTKTSILIQIKLLAIFRKIKAIKIITSCLDKLNPKRAKTKNMMVKLNTIAIACLIICGCSRTEKESNRYVNTEYGVSFTVPKGWKIYTPLFLDALNCKCESPDAKSYVTIRMDIDPINAYGTLDDVFKFFVNDMIGLHPLFMVLTNTQTQFNGKEAMLFYGILNKEQVVGAVVSTQMDLCSVMVAGNSSPEIKMNILKEIMGGLELYGSAISKQIFHLQQIEQSQLSSIEDVRKAIARGNQLLAERNFNINNYHFAILNYMLALNAIKKMGEKLPEYQQAMDGLMLTKSFRITKYHELSLALEQAMALNERNEALKAADSIMKLFPIKQMPEYQYALKQWKKAYQLPIESSAN